MLIGYPPIRHCSAHHAPPFDPLHTMRPQP